MRKDWWFVAHNSIIKEVRVIPNYCYMRVLDQVKERTV